jgi:hypothetical protein
MNKIVSNHGDLILYPVKTLKPPNTAKKSKIHVLQDSGATGNRHEIITTKGFIYRWEKKGVEYIHCDNDYQIRHVGGDCEHGVQEVEAGTREVRHEMEHNPFLNELRIVKD